MEVGFQAGQITRGVALALDKWLFSPIDGLMGYFLIDFLSPYAARSWPEAVDSDLMYVLLTFII